MRLYPLSVCLLAAALAGCRSTPEPEPPPVVSAVVEEDFETVWQTTRDVLLREKLQIYTRDKRGLFVAYTDQHRRLLLFPHRTKLTIALEPLSPDSTQVFVETIHQRYRVTLLTYPDWRDAPKGAEEQSAQQLLDQIVAAVERGSAGTSGNAAE